MKKVIAFILIFLSLSYTGVSAKVKNTVPPLKEGVYRLSNLNTPLDELNYVQNISETDAVYFVIFDENDAVVQTIKLQPKSEKFRVPQLKLGDRIVIIDKGTVLFSKEF